MMHCLFETERLSVRPKTAADAESFHAVYGDDEVMRFSGGSFTTLERSREFVAAHMRHQDVHGFSMWSLVHRGTPTLLGDVGFLAHEDGVEIGWHLRRNAWGRGYATEAARACLAYGFDRLKFTRVSAFTESANAASLRVIEKLGMRLVRRGADDGVPAWAEYVITPALLAQATETLVKTSRRSGTFGQ
jgi:ribosomal-protein-alanine N-acetyltransferase